MQMGRGSDVYRSVGSIMTRYRGDKGDETEEPFNGICSNFIGANEQRKGPK